MYCKKATVTFYRKKLQLFFPFRVSLFVLSLDCQTKTNHFFGGNDVEACKEISLRLKKLFEEVLYKSKEKMYILKHRT